MTAQVITITSGKGGVGKTTATANLGVALASLGNRVACIDADIGLRNLDVVMGLENRIVYDIVDIVEGRARLRQAMIKDKRLQEELYLIPAAQTRDKTAVSPSDMVRLCDELEELVDYILIDSPAGIERGFRNAIAPADEVLIVTNPEVSSVRDADRIIGLIEAEGKGPGRLIINRVKPDMVKRGDMLSPEDVIDILAIKLIGLVPEDETILISTNRGLPAALQLDSSPAGRAFTNIARRLMGEDVPFMALDEEKGWMQRLIKRLRGGRAEAAVSKNEKKPAGSKTEAKKEAKAPEAVKEPEKKEEAPKPAAVKAPAPAAAPEKKPEAVKEPETKAEAPQPAETRAPGPIIGAAAVPAGIPPASASAAAAPPADSKPEETRLPAAKIIKPAELPKAEGDKPASTTVL